MHVFSFFFNLRYSVAAKERKKKEALWGE